MSQHEHDAVAAQLERLADEHSVIEDALWYYRDDYPQISCSTALLALRLGDGLTLRWDWSSPHVVWYDEAPDGRARYAEWQETDTGQKVSHVGAVELENRLPRNSVEIVPFDETQVPAEYEEGLE